MDAPAIEAVLAALEREGVRCAVFGDAALNLHGIARFTEDLDLFIAPDADNIEALKAALRSVYRDESIDDTSWRTCSETIRRCSTSRPMADSTWIS